MNILISIVILIALGLSSCASNAQSSTHHNWKHVNTGRTCKK